MLKKKKRWREGNHKEERGGAAGNKSQGMREGVTKNIIGMKMRGRRLTEGTGVWNSEGKGKEEHNTGYL